MAIAGDTTGSGSGSQLPGRDVEELARFALVKLTESSIDRGPNRHSSKVFDLHDALTNSDETQYRGRLLDQIASGGTSEDLIDRIIPNLARQLGEDWSSDKASFADVTIGASRLQQAVREHGARKEVDGLKSPSGHRVLLLLPHYEQHSLGAFILANQLRRQGIWVNLATDCKDADLEALLEDQNFAMIGMSLGSQRSVDHAQKFTHTIRQTGSTAPIILGGAAVLECDDDSAKDLGADFIATTAQAALDFCQIDAARTPELNSNTVTP